MHDYIPTPQSLGASLLVAALGLALLIHALTRKDR